MPPKKVFVSKEDILKKLSEPCSSFETSSEVSQSTPEKLTAPTTSTPLKSVNISSYFPDESVIQNISTSHEEGSLNQTFTIVTPIERDLEGSCRPPSLSTTIPNDGLESDDGEMCWDCDDQNNSWHSHHKTLPSRLSWDFSDSDNQSECEFLDDEVDLLHPAQASTSKGKNLRPGDHPT